MADDTVALGLNSLLRTLASSRSLTVAIDSTQWLDPATWRAVCYSLRRVPENTVVLLAHRTDRASPPACELSESIGTHVIPLGPLPLAELHAVLMHHLGRSFPQSLMERIATTAAGNPHYALELARSLDRSDPYPIRLTAGLRAMLLGRVRDFGAQTRTALLVSSALTNARIEQVDRVCGFDAAAALTAAEDERVITLSGGRVSFTHPILAHCIYYDANPSTRRAIHLELVELAEDAEERARHLGLAATRPSTDVIESLDLAAEHAERRGALSVAAELLDLSIRLGADAPVRCTIAARNYFLCGDRERAADLLEQANSQLEAGPRRADALLLQADLACEAGDYSCAIKLLQQALPDAEQTPALRSSIDAALALALFEVGDLTNSWRHCSEALVEAENDGEDGLIAEALGLCAFIGYVAGRGTDVPAAIRAVALEDRRRNTPCRRWPSFMVGRLFLQTHRLEEATELLTAVRTSCAQHGVRSSLCHTNFHLTELASWRGDAATARHYADELAQHASMSGTALHLAALRSAETVIAGWVGDIDTARSAGAEALSVFDRHGLVTRSLATLASLGMAELSIGHHREADRWLSLALAATASMGPRETLMAPFLPDAIEVLIALGRADEATQLVEMLELRGRNPCESWAMATGGRSRALLSAARGEFEAATVAFKQAVVDHDGLQLPYEQARTLLAFGRFHRRRGDRRAARDCFEDAIELFDSVGARQWAQNGRMELARLGSRCSEPTTLSPTERRIAEMSATGMTNREVAAALTISPKTVEANLSRAYRKIGIRCRAELGLWLADTRSTVGRSGG